MTSSLPFKAFAIGAALGLVLAVAPSCGSSAGTCGPDNCSSGCCSNNVCLSGNIAAQCGKGGAQCTSCAAGQSCATGSCGSTFTGGGQGGGGNTGGGSGGGGGSSTCSPSNCQTGCCFRNSCFTGRAIDACGTMGIECKVCPDNNVCTTGACEARPDAGSTVTDSGVTVNDSGVTVTDSGTTVTDSGVTTTDSGTTVTDSGTTVNDAGVRDSGMGSVDAGPFDAGTFGGDGGMCHPNVVLSQVYFTSGYSDGINADFVELHNRSSIDVNLNGWSIQMATNNNSSWAVVALTGTLPAYGWYLVQGKVGSNGTALVAPYLVGGDGLDLGTSNSGTKIALVSSTTALTTACPVGGATVVDFMAYGDFASCWEGAPSNSRTLGIFSPHGDSYKRNNEGCQDQNLTATDWAEATAVPRTASTQGNICGCQ